MPRPASFWNLASVQDYLADSVPSADEAAHVVQTTERHVHVPHPPFSFSRAIRETP